MACCVNLERNVHLGCQVWLMATSDHSTGSIDPLLRPRTREDHELLPSLFERHRRRLRGLAAAVTFDQSLADDIVQEAFAGLAAQVDRVSNPIAYLQRSVINLGINAVRRRERFGRLPERRLENTSIPEVDEMWDAIGHLPPLQRAVVVLRFYEDQTQAQIAATLDMPVGSVKSSLHRALSTLRESMQ
jgi:RNA polymerase sigma factor (sigma-70 family)